jgi:hypothetical protein
MWQSYIALITEAEGLATAILIFTNAAAATAYLLERKERIRKEERFIEVVESHTDATEKMRDAISYLSESVKLLMMTQAQGGRNAQD